MIHSNFGQSIQPQSSGDRVLTGNGINLTDRVTIMGPPDWKPLRRAPQLMGMPAFANVRDEQTAMLYNGRPIHSPELQACTDLGVA